MIHSANYTFYFKLKKAKKNERNKDGKAARKFRERREKTNSQARNAICSIDSTQVAQFSSGNKAF